MNLADVAAALLFLGVVAYAILGGADFGSGAAVGRNVRA